MGRRLIATLFSVLVAGTATFLLASPAQAQSFDKKLWDVTFSEDDCSGKTVVTLVNNTDDLRGDGVGLVFNVDGASTTVDAGAVKTVDISYPESAEVLVKLTGAYETPEVEEAVKAKSFEQPQTQWEDTWKRPAGCYEVTAVSTCDNKFTVTVKNLAPVTGEFLVQVAGGEAVGQQVAANGTWFVTYDKGQQVNVDLDGDVSTFAFEAVENCVSPSPSPSTPAPATSGPAAPAPQAGGEGGLPVTGASATIPFAGGFVLLVAVGVALWLRRRREGESVA